jgi:hypothetical protein
VPHPAAPAARRGRRTPRRAGTRPGPALGAALAVAVVLLASVGCTSSADRPKASATTTSARPTPSPTPPPPPPVLWPLTGVVSTAPVDRPALAVKIENSIDARPQTGLNAADMVWEEVVEGGITRYVAVYQSTLPPQIGPVRSVRPMDPSIAAPLRGLLAYSGGQQLFLNDVARSGVQALSFDAGNPGFYRVSSRRAPHNVYATPQKLIDQADAGHRAAPPPQFAFPAAGQQPTAVVAGAPTNVLNLTLSGIGRPQWTWSAPDGRWLRSEGSTPAVTADAGRISAVNVVVLRVDVVITAALDPAGNHVPETLLSGQGQALVASGGRTVAGTWTKNGLADPVHLTGADGAAVTLTPGNTWVELVPNRTGAVVVG